MSGDDDQATAVAAAREQEQEKFKKRCDNFVRSGLSRNVTVQFLIRRLVDMGCEPPQGFIQCMDCGDKLVGGGFGVVEETVVAEPSNSDDDHAYRERAKFRAATAQCLRSSADLKDQIQAQKEGKANLRLLPEIYLCQQHLTDEKHAHLSMVHELIHAVDLCRTKMDPINNCLHMACTEIRAENLSGECDWFREVSNGRIKNFVGHGAECVKRRAILSVEANPNCSANAETYVTAAFEKCHQDTFPFDRHPNLR